MIVDPNGRSVSSRNTTFLGNAETTRELNSLVSKAAMKYTFGLRPVILYDQFGKLVDTETKGLRIGDTMNVRQPQRFTGRS